MHCLLLAHDERRRRTIGQRRGVARGDAPGDLGIARGHLSVRNEGLRLARAVDVVVGRTRLIRGVQAPVRQGNWHDLAVERRPRRRSPPPADGNWAENSSSVLRSNFHRAATSSAPTPWLGRLGKRPPAGERGPRLDAGAHRHRHIDSTPQAITMSYAPAITPGPAKWAACWLEPHWRSTVVPGTLSGNPAVSSALRATLALCSDRLRDAAGDHVV